MLFKQLLCGQSCANYSVLWLIKILMDTLLVGKDRTELIIDFRGGEE